MSDRIKHLDVVITQDGQKLGQAIALFSRPEGDEVNPALKLYGTFLEISNEALGDAFFIPTEFIADVTGGRVHLLIDMLTIQKETFTRKPQFIAWGHGVKTPLPD